MIIIKSKSEIELMREAGKIAADTMKLLEKPLFREYLLRLDKIAEENIRKYNAVPSFKGYGGFPGYVFH